MVYTLSVQKQDLSEASCAALSFSSLFSVPTSLCTTKQLFKFEFQRWTYCAESNSWTKSLTTNQNQRAVLYTCTANRSLSVNATLQQGTAQVGDHSIHHHIFYYNRSSVSSGSEPFCHTNAKKKSGLNVRWLDTHGYMTHMDVLTDSLPRLQCDLQHARDGLEDLWTCITHIYTLCCSFNCKTSMHTPVDLTTK